jgi:hypothetical protein
MAHMITSRVPMSWDYHSLRRSDTWNVVDIVGVLYPQALDTIAHTRCAVAWQTIYPEDSMMLGHAVHNASFNLFY